MYLRSAEKRGAKPYYLSKKRAQIISYLITFLILEKMKTWLITSNQYANKVGDKL